MGATKGRSDNGRKGSPKRGSSPKKGKSPPGSPKAKGAKASPKEQGAPNASKKGEQVLGSFAALQKFRYDEAQENGDKCHGLLPFEATGAIPTGGLGMVWRTVVTEQGLASSRPSSADASKRVKPMSPRSVVNSCLKVNLPTKRRGRTIIVRESEVVSP